MDYIYVSQITHSLLSPSYCSPLVFSSVALTDGEYHQTDKGCPTEISKVKIGLTGEREVPRNMILQKKDTVISGHQSNCLASIRQHF